MDNKTNLFKSVYENNKSGGRSLEKYISKHFPLEYINIINYPLNIDSNQIWLPKLYNYLNNIVELPKCLHCGNISNFKSLNFGYNMFCSGNCAKKSKYVNDKRIKTNLNNFGAVSPLKNKEIREKVKETCLKKYGVDNPLKSQEFRKKGKETCLEKYGVDSHSKSLDHHNKVKKTCLEKYGVDSYNKTDEYKEYSKKINLEKYGTKSYLTTDEFIYKSKITCLEKYGVDHFTKSVEYIEKLKKSNLEKYGVEFQTQTINYSKKYRNTIDAKYKKQYSKILNIDVSDIDINKNDLIIHNCCKIHKSFNITKELYMIDFQII